MNRIDWEGGNQGALEEYYIWLCDFIGYNEDYSELLSYLFDVEFTYILRMDENRAMDGLAMRRRYTESGRARGDIWGGAPCSVLEMLVALSVRIEDEFMGDPDLCMFWRMLDHLGLLTDFHWDLRLDMWLERDYAPNGDGGLFPLRHPKEDQREVEIWTQCMEWLNELL